MTRLDYWCIAINGLVLVGAVVLTVREHRNLRRLREQEQHKPGGGA